MRRAAILLVLVATPLLGPAAAQALVGSSTVLEVQPPTSAIAPQTGSALVPLLLTTTCPAWAVAPEGLQAEFSLARAPAWAIAVIEPARIRIDGASCAGGSARFESFVHLRVGDQSPAFAPDLIEVHAVATAPFSEPASASASFPVVAGYFSVIDVQRSRDVLAPDEDGFATVDLKVTNFGNGQTSILFEVGHAAPDLAVSPPPPLILGSKQAGSSVTSDVVHLRVQRTQPGEIPSAFSVRYKSSYLLDPALVGDQGELSFQVLPAHGMDPTSRLEALRHEEDAQRDLPFGALLLVGAALALAALVRRR